MVMKPHFLITSATSKWTASWTASPSEASVQIRTIKLAAVIYLGNSLESLLGLIHSKQTVPEHLEPNVSSLEAGTSREIALHKSVPTHKPRLRHTGWICELVPTASHPSPLPRFHTVWVGLSLLPKCRRGYGAFALPIRSFYPRGWRCPQTA